MSPCARGGEVRAGDPDLASRPEGGVDERIKSGGRLDSARQLGDSCGNSHIVVISIGSAFFSRVKYGKITDVPHWNSGKE